MAEQVEQAVEAAVQEVAQAVGLSPKKKGKGKKGKGKGKKSKQDPLLLAFGLAGLAGIGYYLYTRNRDSASYGDDYDYPAEEPRSSPAASSHPQAREPEIYGTVSPEGHWTY